MIVLRILLGLVPIVLLVCAAALATWLGTLVFERVRKAVDLRRRRPKRGLVFTIAFSAYALALVVWLIAGFAASIVRASPSLHRRLHADAGATAPLRVTAEAYSFDHAQLTVPGGRPLTVVFENLDRDIEHNFAVYQTTGTGVADNEDGGEERVVASKGYVGPVAREFTLPPLDPGFYSFQCDVEEEGVGNHSRYMTGFLTVERGPPVPFETSLIPTAKRGLAQAYHYSEGPGGVALDYIFSLLALGLGLYLVAKRHLDRVARFFGVGMLGTAAAYNIQSHAALDVVPALANAVHPTLVHFVSGVAYVYAVILFPDGRLVPTIKNPIKRAFVAPLLFFTIIALVGISGSLEPSPGHGHAVAFVQAFGIMVPGVGIAAQSYRYRRAQSAEARQQSKILLWAFVPALALGLGVLVIRAFSGPSGGFTGPQETELQTLAFRVFQPVFIVIPVAIIVGILRYRMWDLDVVINKTILYGSLAAFIGTAYVGIVAGIGRLVGGENNPALAIASTVIVAVAFGTVRERIQRLANALVYGKRATPYEALAEFSSSLAATLPDEDVLPRMAEVAARGVGAVRARVSVTLSEGGRREVAWPESPMSGNDRSLEILSNGNPIGEITVTKAPGDPMTAENERVLAALAGQAGVALEGVRLTEQLHERLAILSGQAKDLGLSRLRIVTAAAAERRRLQQEISDGIESALTDIRSDLGSLSSAGQVDPDDFEALAQRANVTLDRLRDIARGIFPPLLADRGVPAALDAQIRKLEFPVTASFDEAFTGARFDADAEAVLYFCCIEALRATALPNSTLDISRNDGWIEFRLANDRSPRDPAALNDALVRMTDRVEAVGGTIEASAGPDFTMLSGRVPVLAVTQAR